MYNYSYPTVAVTNHSNAVGIAAIIALILAVIGSVLITVLFLRKENEKNLTKVTKPIYDFLQFNKLCIESILKFTYLFLAIFITIISFGFIASSFVTFLMLLIIGNLALRIGYELTMVLILIHRNVREINEKMKK